MWRFLILLTCSVLISTGTTLAQDTHLDRLRAHYPYGLLGDDFGVLSEDDLAINTCDVWVVPFSEKSMAYPYWQCFRTVDTSASCEVMEYDEDEKSVLALLSFSASRQGEKHEYITRRAIHLSDCKSFESDWKRITKNEANVCLSGPYGGTSEEINGTRNVSWVFDKFKTRRGCVSYFQGGCSLKHQIANGCKTSPAAKRDVGKSNTSNRTFFSQTLLKNGGNFPTIGKNEL